MHTNNRTGDEGSVIGECPFGWVTKQYAAITIITAIIYVKSSTLLLPCAIYIIYILLLLYGIRAKCANSKLEVWLFKLTTIMNIVTYCVSRSIGIRGISHPVLHVIADGTRSNLFCPASTTTGTNINRRWRAKAEGSAWTRSDLSSLPTDYGNLYVI